MKDHPGRLTLLIDPETKRLFVQECESADLTPSQVMRRLIRDFMEAHAASGKTPGSADVAASSRDAGPGDA